MCLLVSQDESLTRFVQQSLGTTCGTHLIWRLLSHLPDAQTCEGLARSVGIKVNTMRTETVSGPEFLPDWDRYILLGYADLPEPVIKNAVERLASVWK
jgi:DNA-binding transcriptional MocR family regulator